ncbi:MAG: DNA polymerase III subunit gamma/tau [Pseudomonadota bacterium]
MTYQVFARKYRPQKFAEVAGQEHIKKTLKNAILNNRVAHSYLFSGSRGVGKTTLARLLAKALNCQKPEDHEPCGVCDSCIEIKESFSPDVIEIDGASNRGIDEIRDLREKVAYLPSKSKYKIYIIDEVHMLTMEAFNALLKTLEEPPRHVKFIFATTEPQKVPETISSRCQHFSFSKIGKIVVRDRLFEIAQSENIKISEEALHLISKYTDGSLRDAESIFDQVISFVGNNIEEADVETLLGIPPHDSIRKVVKSIYLKEAEKVLEITRELLAHGYEIVTFYDALTDEIRNILLSKLVSKRIDIAVDPETEAKRDISEIEQMLDILYKWRFQIVKSELADTLIEFVFIKLINIRPAIPISAALEMLNNVEAKIKSNKFVQQDPVKENNEEISFKVPAQVRHKFENKVENEINSSAVAAPIDLPAQSPIGIKDNVTDADKWKQFLQTIEKENPIIHAQLLLGEASNFDDDIIEISFPKGFFMADRLREEKIKKEVEKHLSIFCDAEKVIVIRDKKDTKKKWNNNVGKEYLKDKVVQDTLKEFGGKIINVEEVKK